jgi:hypothetical protein
MSRRTSLANTHATKEAARYNPHKLRRRQLVTMKQLSQRRWRRRVRAGLRSREDAA